MHLFDISIRVTEEEFRAYALNWLERQIGFDGVVWCTGKRDANGGIAIEQCLLQGRPESLITDYAKIAHADPVSQRFSDAPHLLQNVSTHAFYCEPEQKDILDYLEHYRVRHLVLAGVQHSGPMALDWIVLCREGRHRPFDASLDAVISSAISMALSAAQFQRAARAFPQTPQPLAMRQQEAARSTAHLTKRQHQVLDCLMHGWSNKMIARDLGISENTLKTHMASLYRALNVTSRLQAIISASMWMQDANFSGPQFPGDNLTR